MDVSGDKLIIKSVGSDSLSLGLLSINLHKSPIAE
jgi:hypothetical protein